MQQMKPIEEVYPEYKDAEWFCIGEYDPLLESFGYEIVVKVDTGDYQGDSWLLFKNGDQYGFLTFGWGSCSGCDSLQACSNFKDVDTLRQRLHDDIRWDTAEGMVKWLFLDHDWQGDWSWTSRDRKVFLSKVLDYFKELTGYVEPAELQTATS